MPNPFLVLIRHSSASIYSAHPNVVPELSRLLNHTCLFHELSPRKCVDCLELSQARSLALEGSSSGHIRLVL
jgi:hypothetical protein